MKQKKHLRFFALAGAVLVTAALVACDKSNSGSGPQAMMGGGPPPEVTVVDIQPETVTITTELSGRTSAYLVAEVRPQVSGIIQKTLFTEGSEVKEGSVLYQIDPALFKTAYDSAKAALVKAEADMPPAKSKAERYKTLVASRAISQQDYDDAEAALKRAEATLESAKADVEKARINLNFTSIKAPITGRIGKSAVTTGALVTAFQATALATIQKIDPMYVDVTQSSTNLLELKKKLAAGLIKKDTANQTKVKLVLEDGSSYPLEGTLKFSDVTVDPGTGSVILRSLFPNPKTTLLPGMFVRTVIEEGVSSNAILVPQQCVTRDAKGGATAMVVDASGMVGVRPLTIDKAVGNKWLVSSGLAAGDKVIIEGLQKVRPGSPAKVVPYQPAPEKGNPAVKEEPKSATPAVAEKK
jgi:membrane fusion protein (multidrug efflux system)